MEMFNTLITLSVLLASCALTSGQTLVQTLAAADQQLDALTSRVVSLTDQLDQLLKEKDESGFALGHLNKRMDLFEGNF